jgi:hypothetical protein
MAAVPQNVFSLYFCDIAIEQLELYMKCLTEIDQEHNYTLCLKFHL